VGRGYHQKVKDNSNQQKSFQGAKWIYNRDPFNFQFIGPSGFYVKQLADEVARKVEVTVNRDGFAVINQYITELFLSENPGAVVLDREFLKVYIANEIDELIEKEKNDPELCKYAKVLSKSGKSGEYILEIFEKKWEITRTEDINLVNESEIYKEFENAWQDESPVGRLYRKLGQLLPKRLEAVQVMIKFLFISGSTLHTLLPGKKISL
jgi:ATP-dependent helicase/nuclease subunit B